MTGTLSASIGAFKISGGTVTGTGTLTSNAAYDVRGGRVDANLAGNSHRPDEIGCGDWRFSTA